MLLVTPQVYLRNWRIARAHEDLVSGRSTRVTDVALHWGFFDVGRFAGYYRGMFCELPSATLKRLG